MACQRPSQHYQRKRSQAVSVHPLIWCFSACITTYCSLGTLVDSPEHIHAGGTGGMRRAHLHSASPLLPQQQLKNSHTCTHPNKAWEKRFLNFHTPQEKPEFYLNSWHSFTLKLCFSSNNDKIVSTSSPLLSLPKTQHALSTAVAYPQNSESTKLINSCQNVPACSQGKETHVTKRIKGFLLCM